METQKLKTVVVVNRLRTNRNLPQDTEENTGISQPQSPTEIKKKKEELPEYKSTTLTTEAVVAAAACDPNSSSNSWFLGRYKFSHSMEGDDTAAYVNIPVTGTYPERIHLLIL